MKNKLEYAPIVKEKLFTLKHFLTEHYDVDTAKKVLAGILLYGSGEKGHTRSRIERAIFSRTETAK